MRRDARRNLSPFALAVLVALAAACDDQVKYVPFFSTMTQQPSVEAYELEPIPSPAGAVASGEEVTYTLQEAEALVSPLGIGEVDLVLGQQHFEVFCTPCHGSGGRGDGPVVGENRIPAIPTLDLHSEQARAYTDGYIWGMITNGRGLMPSYRRIPPEDRWHLVAYLRALHAGAAR